MLLRSRRTPPASFIEPCLPSTAERPSSGPGWLHETKLDGFRLTVRREPAGVRLLTRNGIDWRCRGVRCSSLMDGEAVAYDGDGVLFDRLRYQRADGGVFLMPSICF